MKPVVRNIIIAKLALTVAGAALLPAFAHAASKEENKKNGWNIVPVVSCTTTADGIRIQREPNGPSYELKNGIRDAGHGLRDYTLSCVTHANYKVEWKAVDKNLSVAPAKAPTLLYPKSGAVLKNFPRKAWVSWTPVQHAFKYEVEVNCDACGYTTPWKFTTTHTTKQTSILVPPLPGDNAFRVRVRGIGKNGEFGPWSDFTYFSFKTTAKPLPIKPAAIVEPMKLAELIAQHPTTLAFEDTTGDLATKFWADYGISFTAAKGKAIFITPYNRGYQPTASGEYSIANDATYPNTSANDPLVITFKEGVNKVGFFLGNGEDASGYQVKATIRLYGKNGELLQTMHSAPIGKPVTTFFGATSDTYIYRVTIDYGNTTLSESIDSLMTVRIN